MKKALPLALAAPKATLLSLSFIYYALSAKVNIRDGERTDVVIVRIA